MVEIKINLEDAENILKALENAVSMGFAIVSQDIKDIVSKDAYDKLAEIFYKYHNANCGPFNRALKKLIDDAKTIKPQDNSKIGPPVELPDAWRKIASEIIEGDYIGPLRGEMNVCLNVIHFWKCLKKIVEKENKELIKKAFDLREESYPEDLRW